jgi:imidazoleglycerol-phosphate dehydratase
MRYSLLATRYSLQAMRRAEITRSTTETKVTAAVDLDGTGRYSVATGVGFLDHMLEQLARHSLIDIEVKAEGDLHIDQHHTTEDVGIALGQAIAKALGDRRGIARYASIDLPMDEALTRAAVDVSGRPYLVWQVSFPTPKIGAFDTELVREFFQALAQHAGLTLHVTNLYGDNSHHLAETCFKAVARALRTAFAVDPRAAEAVPSTKGTLTG